VGWGDHHSKLTHLNTRDRNAPSVSIHRNIGRCLRRPLTCGRSNNLFALVNDPLHVLFCTAVNIVVTAVEPVIWLKDVQLLNQKDHIIQRCVTVNNCTGMLIRQGSNFALL